MLSDAELVRLAAEKVMGWRVSQKTVAARPYFEIHRDGMRDTAWWPGCQGSGNSSWNPIVNDSDCWQMVDSLDALATRHMDVHLNLCARAANESGLPPLFWFISLNAPERRHALVVACLDAVGVDITKAEASA